MTAPPTSPDNDTPGLPPGADVVGTAPGDASLRTHAVRKGETLSDIAATVYGDAAQWRRIYDANRDQLDDPDHLHPGQVLVLPSDAT